ncbi:MAG: phosphomannomutase/phosphoglucomutase [Bryobacterales bacterium]|nr:phosphomannomutase/phosphoglucomutase [Bryobacterales bacterium]
MNPNIFREYDIRGIADRDLPSPDIETLGRGIGTYLRRAGVNRLTLARDCRLSGQRLQDALLKGILSTGCDVTGVGCVPTPLLYYSVFHLQAGGGVMITGSHNPSDYNGFKVMLGKSTIHGEQIRDLLRLIQSADFASGQGRFSEADVIAPYVAEVASQFDFPRRIKVVLDAGNGTAGPVMRRLLAKLNVDPIELFFEMDGHFPNHHPDPTVEDNLEHLRRAVRQHKAELGIAFDGDGDRIGAVDEHGNVVWGDMLLLIYAREILSRKPGATFIGEVKCSQALYDGIRALGGNPIMYKTGHSLIKSKMKEERAELAGEMSGHMFFADRYYGFDDALYSACRLMEIVAASANPLSAQLEGVPRLVSTPEIRFDCPDDIKFSVVERVASHFRNLRPVMEVDGVRVLFEKGWGLVRASNTQPILVMRFEAESQRLLDDYRNEVEQAVRLAL